ncbi:MAG TPA: hypothetical protein PLK08_01030 [Phycisphaerae bacterium]|nr:hypothetical protein [Phycisphaerae bacterium]
MRITRQGQIGNLLAGEITIAAFLIAIFTYFTFIAATPIQPAIVVQTEHFRIHAATTEQANKIASLAENSLYRISTEILTYKSSITSKIDVFIWSCQHDFSKSLAYDKTSGTGLSRLLLAEDGTILRRIDIIPPAPVNTVLPHEIAHLLLNELDLNRQKAGLPSIPLALHEGIAILAEGKYHDDLIMKAAVKLCCPVSDKNAEAVGRLSNFEKLIAATNYDGTGMEVCDFYAQSYSFVEYLHAELKPEGMNRLLNGLAAGMPFNDAIQLALGDTSANFKQNLVRKWYAHSNKNTEALIAIR